MTDLELRTLLPRRMEDIMRLQRRLNHVEAHLDELPTPFDDFLAVDAANANVEGAKTDLDLARESIATIRDWLIELCGLVERMAAQRQSAADAYEAGYNARYADLVARLSAPEFFALRQALLKLDENDEIPF